MNWWQRALSHYGEPSTKRHVVAAVACTLCLVTLGIGWACAAWIKAKGELGSGAVAALTFAAGTTAGLAGVAYRKADGTVVPPPADPGGTP